MPQLSIEYSVNSENRMHIAGLYGAIHETIKATRLFELSAVRVHAIRCGAYAITDLLPENSFIDEPFRVGRGRSDEEKRRTGEEISLPDGVSDRC